MTALFKLLQNLKFKFCNFQSLLMALSKKCCNFNIVIQVSELAALGNCCNFKIYNISNCWNLNSLAALSKTCSNCRIMISKFWTFYSTLVQHAAKIAATSISKFSHLWVSFPLSFYPHSTKLAAT